MVLKHSIVFAADGNVVWADGHRIAFGSYFRQRIPEEHSVGETHELVPTGWTDLL